MPSSTPACDGACDILVDRVGDRAGVCPWHVQVLVWSQASELGWEQGLAQTADCDVTAG